MMRPEKPGRTAEKSKLLVEVEGKTSENTCQARGKKDIFHKK